MDGTAIILALVQLIPHFIPRPEPPTFDYASLRAAFPKIDFGAAATQPIIETVARPVVRVASQPKMLTAGESGTAVATSCMACSRSHLSTVTGALNEALRFARADGIGSPEVQRRLMMAEDEINVMERIDLSAEAIQNSPPDEQLMARRFLPQIRKVRQDLGQIATVEELERVSADSSVLAQEFRLGLLQSKGVDLNPVMELAKRVQAGELTLEEAKVQLKKILPEEE